MSTKKKKKKKNIANKIFVYIMLFLAIGSAISSIIVYALR